MVRGRAWARWWCALVLALAGCGYESESERAYQEAKEKERLALLEQRNALVATVPDQEVLTLVYDTPAPDGSGSTKEWIGRKATDPAVQVLFPRWQVMRRGANRYEVRYTYTFIDATNHLSRMGYAWNVDASLRLVGTPQSMTFKDPQPQGRTFSQQQERRIREEEASLE